MHRLLYNNLYSVYPKLKIYADELGNEEFKVGFKKYVQQMRPKDNLFNEYDFDFTNSKDSNLVQLADIVVGSFARSLIEPNAPKFDEILSGKLLHIEHFPNKNLPHITTKEGLEKFNQNIYSLSVSLANEIY